MLRYSIYIADYKLHLRYILDISLFSTITTTLTLSRVVSKQISRKNRLALTGIVKDPDRLRQYVLLELIDTLFFYVIERIINEIQSTLICLKCRQCVPLTLVC